MVTLENGSPVEMYVGWLKTTFLQQQLHSKMVKHTHTFLNGHHF